MIDYVLKIAGVNTLSYIGHAQGNTIMFTALAEGFGNLNEKLNLFIALAPLTYVQGTAESSPQHEKEAFPYLQQAVSHFKIHEVFGSNRAKASDKFCVLFERICDGFGFRNWAHQPQINKYSAIL